MHRASPEIASAADLARRMTELYRELGFEQLRKALTENDSFEAVNAASGKLGDYLQQVVDPDIEIDFSQFTGIAPDQAIAGRGRQGWVEMWRTFVEPWSDWRIEDAEFHELDPNTTINRARWVLRGRESGIEVAVDQAAIWRSREGRLVGMQAFSSEEAAREALAGGS